MEWDTIIVKRTYVHRTHSYRYNGEPCPCFSIREHTETLCACTLRCFLNFAILSSPSFSSSLTTLFLFSLHPSVSIDILSQSVLCSFLRYKHLTHPLKRLLPPRSLQKKQIRKVTRWSIRILIIRRSVIEK